MGSSSGRPGTLTMISGLREETSIRPDRVYASGNLPSEPYRLEGADVTLMIHKIELDQPLALVEEAVCQLRRQLLTTTTTLPPPAAPRVARLG
jgi:hypothetical protein